MSLTVSPDGGDSGKRGVRTVRSTRGERVKDLPLLKGSGRGKPPTKKIETGDMPLGNAGGDLNDGSSQARRLGGRLYYTLTKK